MPARPAALTFVSHTIDTAPEKARPIIEATTRKFGYVPEPVARMAESPELLSTFLAGVAVFDRSTLTEVERVAVVMTTATRVECHYCVAMHTPKLPSDIAEPLRSGKPLDDARLEALRQFTTAVLATSGGVSEKDMAAFLAAGFTRRNALDVVLGVGTYTLSAFANRLTGAPLDAEFEPYRWEPHHTGRSATGGASTTIRLRPSVGCGLRSTYPRCSSSSTSWTAACFVTPRWCPNSTAVASSITNRNAIASSAGNSAAMDSPLVNSLYFRRTPQILGATAPLSEDGHVNLSPKGRAGCSAILDERTFAYVDIGGSGAETIAHLGENGRVTVMWCAFDGPPTSCASTAAASPCSATTRAGRT